MIEPWKNPRSTFWWFRRRVPTKYLGYGMPAEIKFSLETKDWDEAFDRCQEINLGLERQWRATLENGGKTADDELTHLQIVALAGEFYRETVAKHREDPGPAADWEKKLRTMEEVKHRRFLPPGAWLPIVYGAQAREFLASKGVRLGGKKFDSFLESFLAAQREAAGELVQNAKGDYSVNEQAAARYPKFEPVRRFEPLWTDFCKARKLAASTRKKWKPYLGHLIRRLGSDDMGRVTEQHLIEWRDALLETVPSPVTVKDGYIAAAKSFFGWAKRMKKLPANPADDVNVDISGKHGEKKRGFTEKEARVILSAALAPMNELMTAENAASRKWVPWLCAYTGARVNEITQLRASDVRTIDGIACVHITPEAGTVKTVKERTVPLHPHLIEMGFPAWARTKRGKTPLFYSTARQRNPDRVNPTYTSVGNKLGEWVRGLGIKDKRVWPNHGWRHRFKTVARKVRMDPEVRDAIQGHKPRTEGEEYGEFPPDVMLHEIEKLPRYQVVAGERRDGRRRDQKTYRAAANS